MFQVRKVAIISALMVTTGVIGAFAITNVFFPQNDSNRMDDSPIETEAMVSSIEIPDEHPANQIVSNSFADFPHVSSLDQLKASSSLIVVGRVTRTVGVVNMTMDPVNHELPHPDYFGVGRIYEISVSEKLKGMASDTIRLVQYEATIRRDDSSFDLETVADSKPDSNFSPLLIGLEYVLFLREWPSNSDYYVPAEEPYRFVLVDGAARSEGMMKESSGLLAALEADQLISEIRSD